MLLLLVVVLGVSGQISEKLLVGYSLARVLLLLRHLLLMLLDRGLLGLLLQKRRLMQGRSLLGDVMGR